MLALDNPYRWRVAPLESAVAHDQKLEYVDRARLRLNRNAARAEERSAPLEEAPSRRVDGDDDRELKARCRCGPVERRIGNGGRGAIQQNFLR